MNQFLNVLTTNRKICCLNCIKDSRLTGKLKVYGTITAKNDKFKNFKVLELTQKL